MVAIIDVNRLGQRGETMLGWNTGAMQIAHALRLERCRNRRSQLDEVRDAFIRPRTPTCRSVSLRKPKKVTLQCFRDQPAGTAKRSIRTAEAAYR
jgi:hypothetical protein